MVFINNGHLDCALVQPVPLQADRSCLTSAWQHADGLQIIEVPLRAREAIPQPPLQPTLSKETRSSCQPAQLSRASYRPFIFVTLDKSKPHRVKPSLIA